MQNDKSMLKVLVVPMDVTSDVRSTRREVLRAAARYAAASGIVLLSAGLILKSRLVGEDQRCAIPEACRGCRSAPECRLPAAVRFRTGEEDGHSCLSEDGHSCPSED